ncbi:MAG: PASTA domain-containing protein, partial [Ruminococcus sp.]|nr:PASTA domain-containing protein [Ruminococcus sp.]
ATIPDVIGNEAEDAERKLTEAGFKPVLRSAYDDAHEGQVVRIEPAAGTEAPLGSTVMIYVYKYAEYKNDLTFNLSIPKGLRGSFSVVVHSDDYYYGGGIYDFNGEDDESNAIPIYLSSNKDTDVFTITLKYSDTGKFVKKYKVEADFRTGESKIISDYNTEGLLAISPKD